MKTSSDDRLKVLITHGEKAREQSAKLNYLDDAHALSPAKREAWGRFLLSIATTESIEETLIVPLRSTLGKSALMKDWLALHGEDEKRHFQLLTDYVKKSFSLTKNRRTQSDVVVYDTLLPKIAQWLSARPACFLGVLYFYEIFSVEFYKGLKERATADQLYGLLELIQTIEKDELRHLAGLELVLESVPARTRLSRLVDRAALKPLLELLLVDIHVAPWAIHNRKVRGHLLEIGLNPDELNQHARKSAARALKFATKEKS